jgi:hypothetical protein
MFTECWFDLKKLDENNNTLSLIDYNYYNFIHHTGAHLGNLWQHCVYSPIYRDKSAPQKERATKERAT